MSNRSPVLIENISNLEKPFTSSFNVNPAEFEERVADVSRVVNVTAKGRDFSFAVLMVVGNRKGLVGYGRGKGKTVADARGKALKAAYKKLYKIPLRSSGTITHKTSGKYGATSIVINPAQPGTGVIVGGSAKYFFELCGCENIVAKAKGSGNSLALIRATIEAVRKIRTVKTLATLRGRTDIKAVIEETLSF